MGKRYFWLKLQEDFFSSLRIKKLRRIAGGDTYTIIYLKMQLKALKTDGVLRYTGVENTFADELALDLDEDPDNVAVALSYLAGCGLIETSDDINYFLPYVKANTGSETASARRVRDFRERQAEALQTDGSDVTPALPNESDALQAESDALQAGYTGVTSVLQCNALQCNTDVTNMKRGCNVEREREKEIDIDLSLYNNNIRYVNMARAREETDVDNVENVDNVDNPADLWKTEVRPYGSSHNVWLSGEEVEMLMEEFPTDYARRIETLSGYLLGHPDKHYDSHYATIKLWAARDAEREQRQQLTDIGRNLGFADDMDLLLALRDARQKAQGE